MDDNALAVAVRKTLDGTLRPHRTCEGARVNFNTYINYRIAYIDRDFDAWWLLEVCIGDEPGRDLQVRYLLVAYVGAWWVEEWAPMAPVKFYDKTEKLAWDAAEWFTATARTQARRL